MSNFRANVPDGYNGWLQSTPARFGGHLLAFASLLWTTLTMVLFFCVNASETYPIRLSFLQLLGISDGSLAFAGFAAFLRSKLFCLAVPLITLVLSFFMYGEFYAAHR